MFGILLFFSWLFFSQLPAPAVQAPRAACPRARNLRYSAAHGEPLLRRGRRLLKALGHHQEQQERKDQELRQLLWHLIRCSALLSGRAYKGLQINSFI